MGAAISCPYCEGWFTALWNSLFILFKFHYLAKEWNLEFEFGIWNLYSFEHFRSLCQIAQGLGTKPRQKEKLIAYQKTKWRITGQDSEDTC